jgi:hypothetical protein
VNTNKTIINVKMRLQQETKGSYKYVEVLDDGTIAAHPGVPGSRLGVQYIRKSAFAPAKAPEEINIQVTVL